MEYLPSCTEQNPNKNECMISTVISWCLLTLGDGKCICHMHGRPGAQRAVLQICASLARLIAQLLLPRVNGE